RHPPALALDDVAVAQGAVGDEIAIGAFLAASALAARRAMRPEAERRGGGGALQRGGGGRMVEVGMGDQDMADRLAGDCREQRVDMVLQRRSRIDDGDAAPSEDRKSVV